MNVPRAPQLALYEEQQGEHGEDGEGADEAGLEPVAAATFLQHDLQRAEAGDHRADAEPVGLAQAFAVAVAGADRPGHRGQQGDPRQQLQEKDPAPGIGIRQPAADRRAGGLGHAVGKAEQRHAEGYPAGRQLGEDQLHRQRDQHRPRSPLDHPDQDQRRQVRRQRAAQRTEQEHQRAEEHHPAQGEHFHQPGGKRDHADFRDQIGGGDPRALLEGGSQRAFYLRQRRAGDVHVHAGHEAAEQAAGDGDPGTQRYLVVSAHRRRLRPVRECPRWRSPTSPAAAGPARRRRCPGGYAPGSAGRSW